MKNAHGSHVDDPAKKNINDLKTVNTSILLTVFICERMDVIINLGCNLGRSDLY